MIEANRNIFWSILLLSIFVPTLIEARGCKYYDRNVCIEGLLKACRLFVSGDATIRGNLTVQGRISNNWLDREINECCTNINNTVNSCCETTNENVDYTRETILDVLKEIGGSSSCEQAIEAVESCCEITNININTTRTTMLDEIQVAVSTSESAIVTVESCCLTTNININNTRQTIMDELLIVGSSTDNIDSKIDDLSSKLDNTIGSVNETIDCSAVKSLTSCDLINNANLSVVQWLKGIFYTLNHATP